MTHQNYHIYWELLDQSIGDCIFAEDRTQKSENDHVSEERPVEKELPRKILKKTFLRETFLLSLAEKLAMDVALCEMQRKCENDVGTNTDNRVIGKKKLWGME